MIEVKVTFSGLKIEELKLESTIKQLIQNLAEYAERTMRSEAPERTGRLKSSIKRKVKGTRVGLVRGKKNKRLMNSFLKFQFGHCRSHSFDI